MFRPVDPDLNQGELSRASGIVIGKDDDLNPLGWLFEYQC